MNENGDIQPDSDEPCYIISVAARLLKVHPQTLRYYERVGLVMPTRSNGNIRLYSRRDIDRLRLISRLIDDLGVNLAGADVILNMTRRMEELRQEMEHMQEEFESELEQLRSRLGGYDEAR